MEDRDKIDIHWAEHAFDRVKGRHHINDEYLQAIEYYVELASPQMIEIGAEYLIHSVSTGLGVVVCRYKRHLSVMTVLPRARKHWKKNASDIEVFVESTNLKVVLLKELSLKDL